jgi:hypothetical protein
VLDVRPLAGDGADLPGIRTVQGFSSYYGELARRLCGAAVTRRSWLVVLAFSDAGSVDDSYRFAFLGRTRAGWKVWAHD